MLEENISEPSKENSKEEEPVLLRNYMERAFSNLVFIGHVDALYAVFDRNDKYENELKNKNGHDIYYGRLIQIRNNVQRKLEECEHVRILVISANKGEFKTGFERCVQTCEHAVLCWLTSKL
ncbi:5295_t:CDS:2 [Funneliformis caledonium]|uniref:5295_t:CDS:1 n=1 Tax=Funneliformis caledonium TaxID=1117310 RepID=A0A9N9ICK0_9GLOM|nr:5295_t:CDS:2 [Funneliformis caledonium]